MEEGTKQGVSGGIVFLIIILCIALGIATGYILNDKVLKEEKTKESKKAEPIHRDKKNKETKKEGTAQKEELDEQKGDSVYKDVSNECFNKGPCEKEFKLNNGNNEITIKINNRGDNNETSIYVNDTFTEELYQYLGNGTGVDISIISKIAYLNTGFIVLEIQNNYNIQRHYYDKNLIKIATATGYTFDDNYRIKEDITSNEISFYKQELSCDNKGEYRNIYQYKLTLLNNNSFKMDYIKDGKIGCAGQS